MKPVRTGFALFASLALATLACAPAEVPQHGTSDHALWASAHTATAHAASTRERAHGKILYLTRDATPATLALDTELLGFGTSRSPHTSSFRLPLRARAPPSDQLV